MHRPPVALNQQARSRKPHATERARPRPSTPDQRAQSSDGSSAFGRNPKLKRPNQGPATNNWARSPFMGSCETLYAYSGSGSQSAGPAKTSKQAAERGAGHQDQNLQALQNQQTGSIWQKDDQMYDHAARILQPAKAYKETVTKTPGQIPGVLVRHKAICKSSPKIRTFASFFAKWHAHCGLGRKN